jgi:uncharacterized membrane protein YdfJ with MMPL/SSD domain
VNGERVEGRRRLRAGDILRVGSSSFEVEGAAVDAPVAAARGPTVVPELVMKDGPLAGERFPVDMPLVLGRVRADITIDDPLVSRRHALVRLVDGTLEIEDLGSLNGIRVNGERVVRSRRLGGGDLVRLGSASFEVEGEPAREPVPQARLARLADFIGRRRALVLPIWAALIINGVQFALHQQDRLTGGGWDVPRSEPVRAAQELQRIPGFSAAGLGIVVNGAHASDVNARIDKARKYVAAKVPDVRPGPVQALKGGKNVILPLTYTVGDDDAVAIADDLREHLVQTSAATTTRVIGNPAVWSNYRPEAKKELEKGERIGFPIILLILLAAFGTLVAAIFPLALGFVSVTVTGALIYWISHAYSMSVYVTNMASMIGIGVSVDYSLFILSRFRTELRSGASKQDALRTALSTAGNAVVFSGGIVVASLAGLFLINLGAIHSMAVGAILVVIVAVLASMTLLPALLLVVGKNVERLGLPMRSEGGEAGGEFWRTWTNAVLRRPVLALLVAGGIMLALASPLLSIKTASRGITLLPKDSDVRSATEAVQRAAGPGFTGPAHIVVGNAAAAAEIRSKVAKLPGVARVGAIVGGPKTKTRLVDAFFTTDPESDASAATLDRIESTVRPIASAHGTTVAIGGTAARERAIKRLLNGNLWKLIIFIVAVSYLVLLVLLRSVLLPLKAVLMNTLSVCAAYGVLVAVFQWGWLDWTGYNSPGYIDVIVPALVLAVTFGLSMDYEVFLLTRIKERWLAHGDSNAAVSEGVMLCARIISSAALIMVAVFSAFAISGSIQLRELGVGLAVAVALDATIVRLAIVPSTMRLLGDWNWWLPAWLDRLIPHVGEASSIAESVPAIDEHVPEVVRAAPEPSA